MVPMLRSGLLKLSSGGWDKRGCFPLLPGESLVEPWAPLQGDWRMSGYGFPFLLKMLKLCKNLVQFFPEFGT